MDTRKEYTKPAIESAMLEQTSLTCNTNQEWSYAVAPFFFGPGTLPECLSLPAQYAKNGAWADGRACDWIIWGSADALVVFS